MFPCGDFTIFINNKLVGWLFLGSTDVPQWCSIFIFHTCYVFIFWGFFVRIVGTRITRENKKTLNVSVSGIILLLIRIMDSKLGFKPLWTVLDHINIGKLVQFSKGFKLEKLILISKKKRMTNSDCYRIAHTTAPICVVYMIYPIFVQKKMINEHGCTKQMFKF